jgi:hypothetical protein
MAIIAVGIFNLYVALCIITIKNNAKAQTKLLTCIAKANTDMDIIDGILSECEVK